MVKRSHPSDTKTRIASLRPPWKIGVLVDFLEDRYQMEVLSGAVEAARKKNACLVCFAGGAFTPLGKNPRNVLYQFVSPKIFDGLVVMSVLGSTVGCDEMGRLCEGYKEIPTVWIGLELEHAPFIASDNHGIRQVISHLIRHHRKKRLAFVRGPRGNWEAELRYRVFQETLARYNVPLNPEWIIEGDFRRPSGLNAALQLWGAPGRKPDAILAANDEMAIGVIKGLQQMKVRVPRDVAVAGFDDIEESRFIQPALTTVMQPLYGQGYKAIEMVLDILDMRSRGIPEQEAIRRVKLKKPLPTKLQRRQSCGCHPARSRIDEVERQVRHRFEAEERERILSEISRGLISACSENELADTIASGLSKLRINGCRLSLYEGNTIPADTSRLVLSYQGERNRELEGGHFPTHFLSPDGLPLGTWIIEPLYFRDRQFGFAIFEIGVREWIIYEELREQISSMLYGMQLNQETRFRLLLEQTFDAICVHKNGEIREANTGFLRMFGYSMEEAIGLPIRNLLLETDDSLFKDLESQVDQLEECAVIRKNGTSFFAEIIRYGDPSADREGQAIAFRDVTIRRAAVEAVQSEVKERRLTEAALLHSRAELQVVLAEKQELLSTITSLLIGIDSDGIITHWNDPAANALALPAAKAIGRPFKSLTIDWDREMLEKELERCRLQHQKIKLSEIFLQLPNGNRRILGLTLTPMTSSSSEKTGVLILGSDITDQMIMQQQLEHRNKLESIGQLAAGIAHEINTPAQFIGGNLRFLKDQLPILLAGLSPDGGPTCPTAQDINPFTAGNRARTPEYLLAEFPRAIDQSLDGIGRIASIVSALSDFSHPGSAKSSCTDLNLNLQSTITIARNEWKYVADVETRFDPNLPLVECFPSDLNQAFLNIIVNGAHAIQQAVGEDNGRRGKIIVETQRRDDEVEIRFTDTGTGIPKAIQGRVFDPFFTTKQVGKGTGQGLAICQMIVVQKHRGSIRFETEEGKGTTFIIRLPIRLHEENQNDDG